MKKNSIFKKIFSSKPLTYLLVLLLLFAFISLGREINRQIHLRGELVSLQGQAISLETENQRLLDELEKIQTDFFKEKAAREKMGLRKIGERMIVIVSSDNLEQEKESNLKYFSKKIYNFKAWWDQFFSKEDNLEKE